MVSWFIDRQLVSTETRTRASAAYSHIRGLRGIFGPQGGLARTWVGTAAVSWILSALVLFISVVFAPVLFARVDLRIGALVLPLCLLVREGVTPPCGNNRNSQQNPMSGLRLRD